MPVKVLSFDVGKTIGWAFVDDVGIETGSIDYTGDPLDWYHVVNDKIRLYKPQAVVSARPTRFARVIAFQSKMLAIIELVARKFNTYYNTDLIDSQCKNIVLGNGRVKKDKIITWAKQVTQRNEITEHEADALMFAAYIRKVGTLA